MRGLTLIVKLVEFKINFLREWLFRTAMSDGMLSDDELNLLFSIELNLTILQNVITKAYEDHIIDEYERDKIGKIIDQIKDDAISSAKFDDCITQEDGVLLTILQHVLIDFQKLLLKGMT